MFKRSQLFTGVVALAVTLTAHGATPYVTNDRGLDRRNMDRSVDPCVDFYQYANGGWMARNPIPADQSSWGVFSELRERNYDLLRDILENAAKGGADASSNTGKAGNYWRTAMDTAAITAAGVAPLAQDFATIDAIASRADMVTYLIENHVHGINTLFDFEVDQDLKDTENHIVYATQGGLGLPDRDYYLRSDDDSVALREKYVLHIAAMMKLAGVASDQQAEADAREILKLETVLADGSLTRVELRDPENYYNILTLAEADAASPAFPWTRLLAAMPLPRVDTFSYAHPKFFSAMDQLLTEAPLAVWKAYFRWHAINEAAPYLSDPFVEQDFDFYSRTLRGTEQMRPRWKRVVDQTSSDLGEVVGQIYVERAFPPATKARALEMIEQLRGVIRSRLEGLTWMSDATREKALEKLSTFVSKIGYPDKWRDYSALSIGTESYLANVRAAQEFDFKRNLDKLGKPLDRSEWSMSPQTVNAYYNPLLNEIVFPAAIMQPPFFDGKIDDAVNYGAMGAIIGHEYMHGFDDQGSRFDARGNLSSWWTDEDREQFNQRTSTLVSQFNEYVVVDDLTVNGELTLGENIGDLAGVTMSYYALQAALNEGGRKARRKVDRFTPEQRFFLAWAQGWRGNYRPEVLKLMVNTDPHSPARFRTNGPLSNLPEFAQAFSCKSGDPMVRDESVRTQLW
ncbi:MAG: M13 family metallopeptidase [Gammaproteobacteria bacterium]|nr:M13 family metallopeptidase [Gammaproteobacteria bacterium]